MNTFVTLFDKNYLTRGLALYTSLERNCPEFMLYVLAMDSETGIWLKDNIQNNKKNISVIALFEVEGTYPELKQIKKERSRAEYCWTLTPYSIQYVLKKYKTAACTYLDADIYFFNSPDLIFKELKKESVVITEHNYTPRYDQSQTSGKYCVQFMYFKNNKAGNEVLEWWRARCKEWCFFKQEDGKFGDQKYLDDWTTRFNCVYVPYRAGAGLAPWNIQKYNLIKGDGGLYIQDKITQKKEELIFYHFHGLKEYKRPNDVSVWYLGQYDIQEMGKLLLYQEYIYILKELQKTLPESLQNHPEIIFNAPYSNFRIIKQVFKNCIKSFLFISRFREFKQKKQMEIVQDERKYYTLVQKFQ